MKIGHYTITQAAIIAAVTSVVGVVVTVVPAWAPESKAIIGGLTAVITGAFLLANAIHSVVAARVSSGDLEGDLSAFVKSEVGRVDFDKIVQDVTAAHGVKGIEGLVSAEVQAELRKILGGGSPPAPAAIVQPAPPAVS